jgi:hypothetical protein
VICIRCSYKGFVVLFKSKGQQLCCVGRVRQAACAGVMFTLFGCSLCVVCLYRFSSGFP